MAKILIKFIFLSAFLKNFCLSVDLDAIDIAKRIATRAKNAIDESSYAFYKNFGTWNYEGTQTLLTKN